MKILMVTSPIVSLAEPFAGGTEAFVVQLSNGLAAKGHHVDVLCKHADETNRFNTLAIEESAMRMCDAITSEADGQKQYQAAQYGLIDTSGYDAVHYHSYYHAIYDYGFMHQRPSVVTLHSPVSERLALAHQLHRARSDDRYIAVSKRLKQEWEAVIGTGIEVINNGIDPAAFTLPPQVKRDYVIVSGRICPDKDITAAITLAAGIGKPLYIAGPISDQHYFSQEIEPRLNTNVRYLGHLDQAQLRTYVAGAFAALATSRWNEPFGLATLEALACDTPVIGFASAIVPELRHFPATQIVSPDNRSELMQAVNAIKTLPQGTCAGYARQFDFAHTLAQYESLYEQLH